MWTLWRTLEATRSYTTADLEEYAYLTRCVGELGNSCEGTSEFCELPKGERLDLGNDIDRSAMINSADDRVDFGGRWYSGNDCRGSVWMLSKLADPSRAVRLQKWLADGTRPRTGMNRPRHSQSPGPRATALPALIGARDHALLRAAGHKALSKKSSPTREVEE